MAYLLVIITATSMTRFLLTSSDDVYDFSTVLFSPISQHLFSSTRPCRMASWPLSGNLHNVPYAADVVNAVIPLANRLRNRTVVCRPVSTFHWPDTRARSRARIPSRLFPFRLFSSFRISPLKNNVRRRRAGFPCNIKQQEEKVNK